MSRSPALVVLADHALGLGAGIIVKVFLELALDDAALFLDHEDLALALHEFQRVVQGERPDHADLVDVDAVRAAGGLVEADQAQRLHQVEMGLAGGDDAVGRARDVVDAPVDGVGLGEGIDRMLLRLHALLDLRPRQIRPAVMQAAGRGREVGLQELARRMQFDRDAGFHDLRYGLEADPHAGEAAQRIAVFAEFEIFADARRMQRRHEPAHEGDVGLMRHRRGDAAMVVAGDHQHAAMGRRAIGVAVLQRIARAVDAGALAVPEAEDALHLLVGIGLDLLRAQHGRCGEVLVDGGQELDPVRLDLLLHAPELEVDAAERRAAIAGDEARRVEAGCLIPLGLIEHDADDGLGAGQEDPAFLAAVPVGEPIGIE